MFIYCILYKKKNKQSLTVIVNLCYIYKLFFSIFSLFFLQKKNKEKYWEFYVYNKKENHYKNGLESI